MMLHLQPKRYRLLVVDDDPDNLILFRLALKKNKLIAEVKTALDGEEALEYLLACREYDSVGRTLPSLILMDLKMPGMDGFEVIEHLKAEEIICRIPVVMFTASREESDISRSYAVGANSFIRKQIDFDTFCSQLEYIIEYWLTINQPPH